MGIQDSSPLVAAPNGGWGGRSTPQSLALLLRCISLECRHRQDESQGEPRLAKCPATELLAKAPCQHVSTVNP